MSDNNVDLSFGEDFMPPQPLSKIKPQAGYGLGPGFLARRPSLAALVAEVIALWSEIELQRGRYLSSLLGANESAGIAMYLAITSAVTRRATLNAASKMILSEQEYELFCKAAQAMGAVEQGTKRSRPSTVGYIGRITGRVTNGRY